MNWTHMFPAESGKRNDDAVAQVAQTTILCVCSFIMWTGVGNECWKFYFISTNCNRCSYFIIILEKVPLDSLACCIIAAVKWVIIIKSVFLSVVFLDSGNGKNFVCCECKRKERTWFCSSVPIDLTLWYLTKKTNFLKLNKHIRFLSARNQAHTIYLTFYLFTQKPQKRQHKWKKKKKRKT